MAMTRTLRLWLAGLVLAVGLALIPAAALGASGPAPAGPARVQVADDVPSEPLLLCQIAAREPFRNNPRLSQMLVFLGSLQKKPSSCISVYVQIDGRSQLTLDGNTARWHHLQAAAPGRHGVDCGFTRTYGATWLNGQPWYPQWPDEDDCENRDCDCDSSQYTMLMPALPSEPFNVVLEAVDCRDTCSIVEYPSAGNGYRVVLEFDDPDGGSGDYWVNLIFRKAPPPP